MTVAELVERLEQFNPAAQMYITVHKGEEHGDLALSWLSGDEGFEYEADKVFLRLAAVSEDKGGT